MPRPVFVSPGSYWRAVKRDAWRKFVVGSAALGLATACSGSAKPVAPSPSVEPIAPPTVSADVGTAIALGPNVALIGYVDHDGRYTVQIPVGWTRDIAPQALTVFLAGDPLRASISVLCRPGLTADELLAEDVRGAANVGAGTLNPNAATPTEVAAVPARAVRWEGKLGV